MADAEIRVQVEDRMMQDFIGSVAPRLRAAVAIGAHNIEARAKGKVPVDTGTTKNSIQPEFSNGGFTARIGPSTSYAVYLEFGTHRMPARPFMIPALESEREPFERAIQNIMANPRG